MARPRWNADRGTLDEWTRESGRTPLLAPWRRRCGDVYTYAWPRWRGDHSDLLQLVKETAKQYPHKEIRHAVTGTKRTGKPLPPTLDDPWWEKDGRVAWLTLLIGEPDDVQRSAPLARPANVRDQRIFVSLDLQTTQPGARLVVLVDEGKHVPTILADVLGGRPSEKFTARRVAVLLGLALGLLVLWLSLELDHSAIRAGLLGVAACFFAISVTSYLLYWLLPSFLLGDAHSARAGFNTAVPVLSLIVAATTLVTRPDTTSPTRSPPPVTASSEKPTAVPESTIGRPVTRSQLSRDATTREVPSRFSREVPIESPRGLAKGTGVAYDCQGRGLGDQYVDGVHVPGRSIPWYRLTEPASHAGGFISQGTLSKGAPEPPHCWTGDVSALATIRDTASYASEDLGNLRSGDRVVVDCQTTGPGPPGTEDLVWLRMMAPNAGRFVSSERVRLLEQPPTCAALNEPADASRAAG